MSTEYVKLRFPSDASEEIVRFIENHALFVQERGFYSVARIHKTYAWRVQDMALEGLTQYMPERRWK